MVHGTVAENTFSLVLAPGQGDTLWLETPISCFQLDLDYSGDIFQASQDVSTQDTSEMANSGQVSSALLICVWKGVGGGALGCSGAKPRSQWEFCLTLTQA